MRWHEIAEFFNSLLGDSLLLLSFCCEARRLTGHARTPVVFGKEIAVGSLQDFDAG